MNNNTFEIFETVIIQRLQKLNKEQLEGASYFLFTLHERLPVRWKTTTVLDELALAELFDIISEMCTADADISSSIPSRGRGGTADADISSSIPSKGRGGTYLKTITQKYKSTSWLNGSLSIINIFRIHLKAIHIGRYKLEEFSNFIKYFINIADELLESDVAIV